MKSYKSAEDKKKWKDQRKMAKPESLKEWNKANEI